MLSHLVTRSSNPVGTTTLANDVPVGHRSFTCLRRLRRAASDCAPVCLGNDFVRFLDDFGFDGHGQLRGVASKDGLHLAVVLVAARTTKFSPRTSCDLGQTVEDLFIRLWRPENGH